VRHMTPPTASLTWPQITPSTKRRTRPYRPLPTPMTVSIDVTENPDDPPVAVHDDYGAPVNGWLSPTEDNGVLDNGRDQIGDALTAVVDAFPVNDLKICRRQALSAPT